MLARNSSLATCTSGPRPKMGSDSRCRRCSTGVGSRHPQRRRDDSQFKRGSDGLAAHRRRHQGPPPGDVGVGRLPVDGRDLPVAARSAARGGMRHRSRSAGPGCRGRHGQRVDPRGEAWGGRRRERPRARAVRRRPPARRGRGRRAHLGRGRRRAPAVRGRIFDVVMSAIGAMFAPHHQEAADELVRVTRPGARSAC